MDAEAMREFDEAASLAGAGLWPVVVVIGGVSYEGTGPEPRSRGVLVGDGEDAVGEVTVWIRKAELGTAPAVDAVMRAHGREWVIREVNGAGDGEAEWCVRGEAR